MKKLLYFFLFTLLIFACGPEKAKTDSDSQNEAAAKIVEDKLSGADGKGIGQVTSVTLESPLDQERIKRGKDIYEMKCSACHKLDEKRVVGPGWAGLTKLRKPEWIMNMILNPEQMTKEDPTAKQLFAEYLTQMTFQDVTQDDARAILEYLRTME